MYGKIVNGKIIYAPTDLIKDNGEVIFNYFKEPSNCLKEGYKLVINEPPEYFASTEYVVLKGYTETETSITILYEVEIKDVETEKEVQIEKCIGMYAQTLSDDDALTVPLVYPIFDYSKYHVAGEKFRYEGVLYKVLQDHQGQIDWNPTNAPSLYAKVLSQQPGEAIPEWEQPDSTNPYMKGDRVIYNGKTYESTIDNNIWSPTSYPQGWSEV